jgi:hypothetical protein
MTGTKLSRVRVQRIDTPMAAKLLSDAATASYIRPFLKSECSISAAAEQAGTTVQRMHYWVGKFCELGLLRMTRSEARPGRAIRYYQATAETFLIPFSATPAETLETLLIQNDVALHRLFNEGLVKAFLTGIDDPAAWGIRVQGEGQDVTWGREDTAESCSLLELMQEAHAPAIVSSTQSLSLTYEEALELQGELLALWQRFEAKRAELSSGGRNSYLLRLGLAPLERV